MTVKEFNEKYLMNRKADYEGSFGAFLSIVPKIRCKDGFKVSVQASAYHYCIPRDSEGPWEAVELGFPTEQIPELSQYAESEDHTETVFTQVPIEELLAVLDSHGGIKEGSENDQQK
jgi:hypothetical protein